MLKHPVIKILVVGNLLVFACLALVNIRAIIRNKERQTLRNASAAEFLEASAKNLERTGEFAYADKKRQEDITNYVYKNKTITNDNLSWIMSLMEKTFPNGRAYSSTQVLFVHTTIMGVETFTPQQKEAIFQKCGRLLADQASGSRLQNPYITETCCQLFAKTKDQRAVPYLTQLLQNPNGRVKTVAARALTELGHPTKMNIPNGGFGTLKNK